VKGSKTKDVVAASSVGSRVDASPALKRKSSGNGTTNSGSGGTAEMHETLHNAPTESSANEGAVENPATSPHAQMPTLSRKISGKESRKGAQKTVENQERDQEAKGLEDSDDEEEEDSSKKEAQKAEAMVGELLCKMIAAGDSSDEQDGKKGKRFMGPWACSNHYDGDDDLNLAGLLNVLDGVVDSPGRVVVMTTNHPEKLDPALIRPGRINKRIHLGYVSAPSLCSMVEHYMQVTLSAEERHRLTTVAQRISVAPAQVEQCCAESDEVRELVKMLDDLY